MKAARGINEAGSRQQGGTPVSALPHGLSCPSCHASLELNNAGGCCPSCGRTVVVHGGRIADFLAGDPGVANAILGWPEGLVRHAEPWLLAVSSGGSVDATALAELENQHLLQGRSVSPERRRRYWRRDAGCALTGLGSNLAYHCAEFSFQSAKETSGAGLDWFVGLTTLAADSTVLDVGCGAGQTLRLLRPYHPAERVGLDVDLEALAFGCRLAESKGDTIHFVRGSAHQIPFPDGRFSHVICRVALNYVHQRRALREMVRVLQPGGYLYCSVEGLGFDLHFLRQARNPAHVLSRLRDLFYGLVLVLTGAQPAPRGRLTGGRASGTIRRCTRALSCAGCTICKMEITSRYLGLPMAFDMVGRKHCLSPQPAFAAL